MHLARSRAPPMPALNRLGLETGTLEGVLLSWRVASFNIFSSLWVVVCLAAVLDGRAVRVVVTRASCFHPSRLGAIHLAHRRGSNEILRLRRLCLGFRRLARLADSELASQRSIRTTNRISASRSSFHTSWRWAADVAFDRRGSTPARSSRQHLCSWIQTAINSCRKTNSRASRPC